MDASAQVLRRHADVIECWDDDPDFANLDAIQQCTATSPAYSTASTDVRRRESVSSRMSMQSYADFDDHDVKEHQLALGESPASAISSAISAGIPIPENTPSSALIGGCIKRLGTRDRSRKVSAHDDWSEDLELPNVGNMLAIKQHQQEFPVSLQSSILSRETSPARISLAPVVNASSQLNKYRDDPADEDFFADTDELPPLKLSPSKRSLNNKLSVAPLITPPPSDSAPRTDTSVDDDFDKDFEFPADAPLSLNIKIGQPTKTTVIPDIDTVFEEWDSQSNGGTQKDHSASEDARQDSAVVSPSSATAESEDEGPLDGLELPEGLLPDFHALLEKKRQAAESSMDIGGDFKVQKDTQDIKEEFFEGLEIGDGEIFDSKKLTLNRNVKHRQLQRKPSPVRRTAASLTFTTNRSAANQPPGRMGRLTRDHPTLLPPLPILEERENQTTAPKRTDTRSRWNGGTNESPRWVSRDCIPPPPPIPHSPANKPSHRGFRQENNPPTTTGAQLLRAKRSMPNMSQTSASQSPNRARPPSRNSSARPPSRSSATRGSVSSNSSRPNSSSSRPASGGGRPSSRTSVGRPSSRTDMSRPKTPHNGTVTYKHPAPFLPAGTSNSHHVAAKSSRQVPSDIRSNSRAQMRNTPRHTPSSSITSDGGRKIIIGPAVAPEHLRREAAAIGTLTQPTRKRNFGDGTELETFDDLPTSTKVENRYTVNPVTRGAPRAMRRNTVPVHKPSMESPQKKVDTLGRGNELPRFARDTNASRNARAQTLSRLGMSTSNPECPPSPERWRKQIAARNSVSGTPRNRKKAQKPHLIKPLGNISNLPKATSTNGMMYNPRTYSWEGNEKDLRQFDRVETPTTPRPALITNVNQTAKIGVQVVGGMVFDPTRMCWLKVDEDPEDEADPFEGLEDLVEQDMMSIDGSGSSAVPPGNNTIIMGGMTSFGSIGRLGGMGAISGEFVVGEEFDVGPEFVRRQREEEERWRSGVEGWISSDLAARPEARYALRELLGEQ